MHDGYRANLKLMIDDSWVLVAIYYNLIVGLFVHDRELFETLSTILTMFEPALGLNQAPTPPFRLDSSASLPSVNKNTD